MSGDQSAYIRGKMAERGVSSGVSFMKDGFDKWAESTAPARAGQVEKLASEPTEMMSGGAMTVSQAKQMFKKVGSQAKHLMKQLHMVGGNRTIWGFELSDMLNQAADWTLAFSEGYLKIKEVLDKFLADLDRQIIKNTDYSGPDADADDKALVEFAKSLKTYFDKWKATMGVIGAIAKFVKDNLGQPPPPDTPSPPAATGAGLRGGKTYTETWASFTKFVQDNYNKVKDVVMWFFEHRNEIYGLLRTLDSLQPTGGAIADVLETILGKPAAKVPTGAGKRLTLQFFEKMNRKHSGSKHKMSGGKKCSCHGGSAASIIDAVTGPQPIEIPSRRPRPALPTTTYSEDDASPLAGFGKVKGGKKMSKKSAMGLMQLLGNPVEVEMEIGSGRKVGGASCGGIRPRDPSHPVNNPALFGNAKKAKKPSARGEIVKKVMREQGLSLPQASKYVKEHGLY
jgi:hypothetical protein